MDIKMYAQFNEEGICTAVGTPNITGIEATYDNIGMRYENGGWSVVPKPVKIKEPSLVDVAQMISDLEVELIVAGVI